VGARNLSNHARNSRADGWQTQAWHFYHTIGEFRYACDWVGSMLSKAILYATEEVKGVPGKLTSGPAMEILDELFGDTDGKAEMLRLLGIHFSVAGEAWIVAYPDPDEFGDGGDVWEVVASTRITRPAGEGGYWRVNDKTIEVDPNHVLAIRLWRPDPVDPDTAISPARALLSTLRQLEKLGEHVSAQIDSRLAGAGLLLVPSEMTFATPPNTDPAAPTRSANNADELMTAIIEMMGTAIENRDSAEALAPLVITAPADAIQHVQHLTFWSGLDEKAIEMRDEAIRRLALGMDMPPEVLQGSADSNHWAAWQADESSIKSHTEPLLKIITTSLASGFLRPLLKGTPGFVKPLRSFSIAADTSEMRLRPNRSKEALELFNLGLLSRTAVVRETGFDDIDVMDEKEYSTWLTQKVASGSTTPELVEAALKELGVNLTVLREVVAGEVVQPDTGTEARPAPSLKDHPTRELPDPQKSERRKEHRDAGDVPSSDVERRYSQGALIAAADQIVVRALERAGNKLKNKMQVKPAVAAAELYTFVTSTQPEAMALLDDAWTQVPVLAERHGVDPAWLEAALYDYCEGLMMHQTKHEFQRFAGYMVMNMHVNNQMEAAA
jgi:hypothetical protein